VRRQLGGSYQKCVQSLKAMLNDCFHFEPFKELSNLISNIERDSFGTRAGAGNVVAYKVILPAPFFSPAFYLNPSVSCVLDDREGVAARAGTKSSWHLCASVTTPLLQGLIVHPCADSAIHPSAHCLRLHGAVHRIGRRCFASNHHSLVCFSLAVLCKGV